MILPIGTYRLHNIAKRNGSTVQISVCVDMASSIQLFWRSDTVLRNRLPYLKVQNDRTARWRCRRKSYARPEPCHAAPSIKSLLCLLYTSDAADERSSV